MLLPNAVYELISHGVAADEEEACEISIKAGTDMDMHSGIYMRYLPNLVRQGKVPQQLVDQAVRRILAVKFKLNLFERPFVDSDLKNKVILSEQHLETARQLAKESIVLLKNDDKILPLSKELSSIAVIGPLADNKKDPLGCWSFDGKPGDVVSLSEGIKAGISSTTAVYYAQGCGIEDESAGLMLTSNPGCLLQMKLGIEREGLVGRMEAVHLVDFLHQSRVRSGIDPS